MASLFLSRYSSYGYDQRCEISGTDGLVAVGNVPQHATVLSNSTGTHQSRLQHSFPQRFREAFSAELDAFADTLLLDQAWPVTRDQCIRVQRVADAAQLSAETGEVVSVETYRALAAS
jgi:myo-inositol 2-dehydrogenase/D-chiro-inositol 1-dehydrogenase